ncbi:hypothetical protein OKW40_004066 [Paraburkholderia sp. RAU6.4a]
MLSFLLCSLYARNLARDEHVLLQRAMPCWQRTRRRRDAPAHAHFSDRIDDRVADHDDLLRRDAFSKQAVARTRGRCEMQRRDAAEQAAVRFLGTRTREIAGAQPRLDVADADAALERREARAKRDRRVALHDDPVGTCFVERAIERGDQTRRERLNRCTFID